MGLRVQKFLGYGLVDVEFRGYEQIDPRIDTGVLDRLWEEDRLEEYGAFLERQEDDEHGIKPALLDLWWFRDRDERQQRGKQRTLDDCFAWGVEYRLGNVIAVQPLAAADWRRHDDMIDWVEETYRANGEPQRNWVDVLPHGIYPWSGSYMDARDGRHLPHEVMTLVRVVSHAREKGTDPVELADRALDARLWEELGFEDVEQAVENTVPLVPDEVRLLCEFVGLFTDGDAWKQLRPLLYTWWS